LYWSLWKERIYFKNGSHWKEWVKHFTTQNKHHSASSIPNVVSSHAFKKFAWTFSLTFSSIAQIACRNLVSKSSMSSGSVCKFPLYNIPTKKVERIEIQGACGPTYWVIPSHPAPRRLFVQVICYNSGDMWFSTVLLKNNFVSI